MSTPLCWGVLCAPLHSRRGALCHIQPRKTSEGEERWVFLVLTRTYLQKGRVVVRQLLQWRVLIFHLRCACHRESAMRSPLVRQYHPWITTVHCKKGILTRQWNPKGTQLQQSPPHPLNLQVHVGRLTRISQRGSYLLLHWSPSGCTSLPSQPGPSKHKGNFRRKLLKMVSGVHKKGASSSDGSFGSVVWRRQLPSCFHLSLLKNSLGLALSVFCI